MPNEHDGSVVIDVSMNVGKAEKDLAKLKGKIEQTENDIENITKKRDEAKEKSGDSALSVLEAEKKKLSEMEAINKRNVQTEKKLSSMLSYAGTLETQLSEKTKEREDIIRSLETREKSYKNLAEQIAQLKLDPIGNAEEIKEKVKDLNFLGVSISKGESAAKNLNGRIRVLKEEIDSQNASIEQTAAKMTSAYSRDDVEKQKQKVKVLSAEFNQAAREVTKYDNQLLNAGMKLDQQKNSAGQLAEQIEKANAPTTKFRKKIALAEKGVDKLTNRISRLAKRVLFFSVVTMALRSMRTWFVNVIKTNDQARESIAKLKGALLTLVQPLVNVIIPAFIKLVDVLTSMVSSIAALVSNIFGTTAEESAESAKKLNDEQKALNGVGGAAKKAGKQLAAFDEINKVGDESGGGGASKSEEIAPNFTNVISDTATSLLTNLGLLVIGALLTFTGAHVLLGIGMMALGAYGMYKEATENPDAVKEALEGWVGNGLILAGIAALVIGALLAFSGFAIPLGIALMAIGVATMVLVATMAPDKMKETLSGWVGEALVVAGIIAVVIGVLLAFSGVNIPIGIGLILLGAAAIAAEAVYAPEKMSELLNGWVGEALIMIGIFALTIGVVLAFGGLNIPLGIGLILLGAAAIFTEAALAPDKMKEMLNGWLGAALVVGGIIAVVIGIILICTGAGLPLGIALLVLGIGALVAGIVPNWDFIVEKISNIWESCKKFWNQTIVPGLKAIPNFFIRNVINKLIGGAESFINFFIDGINALIGKLNTFGFDLPEILGGGRVGVSIPKLERISISRVPELAQGAVIPPNREFMAVLGDQKSGTNIETPLSTMVQAFRQAMAETGVGRNITVIMEVDKREFGRVVYKANNEETQRVGVRLTGARA